MLPGPQRDVHELTLHGRRVDERHDVGFGREEPDAARGVVDEDAREALVAGTFGGGKGEAAEFVEGREGNDDPAFDLAKPVAGVEDALLSLLDGASYS